MNKPWLEQYTVVEFPVAELFGADTDCQHEVAVKWSGVECKKCPGWFCY